MPPSPSHSFVRKRPWTVTGWPFLIELATVIAYVFTDMSGRMDSWTSKTAKTANAVRAFSALGFDVESLSFSDEVTLVG